MFALSYMTEGSAAAWADLYTDRALDTEDWGTWANFKRELTEQFGDSAKEKAAQHALENLKQGSKTADEFFTEFDTLVSKAKYSEATHSDYLMVLVERNMGIALMDKVANIVPAPTTYTGLRAKVQEVDRAWRRRVDMKRSFGFPSGPAPRQASTYSASKPATTTPSPAPRSSAPGPSGVYPGRGQPMDIDARNEDMKNRACFRCHKPGHVSRFCPEKRTNNSAPAAAKPFSIREVLTSMSEEDKAELRKMLMGESSAGKDDEAKDFQR
jgi:hypothetical protein